jgi:hypothetical protein
MINIVPFIHYLNIFVGAKKDLAVGLEERKEDSFIVWGY